MIGTLSLTEQLQDCELGVPKELTVLVIPTRNDPGAFEAEVQEMVGYEHEEPEPPAEPAVAGVKARKGVAPAVTLVIGKGK